MESPPELTPEKVYRFLATPEGRQRFWAESAEEKEQDIEFRFSDRTVLLSRIISREPPKEFCLTYFDGSTVTFRLNDDGRGGERGQIVPVTYVGTLAHCHLTSNEAMRLLRAVGPCDLPDSAV
jgi:uncharacterized protein YndB with AHSA1/START domain